VYARVSGRDGVVLLPKYSADQLLKGLNDLREKKLFAVEAGDIEEIEIAAAGSPRILLRRSGEEWTFVEPAGEVASKSAVKTLTSSLASFRVAEFLPAAPKVEETGLDATATRIAFKTRAGAGGASFALLLGKEYKSGKDAERVYGMLQGGAEVFSVMKYSSKNVVKTVDDLKDKRLFRVEEGDITELTIAHPDQTLTFVRQPDGKWKMTAPKELAAVTLAPTVSTLASLDVEKVTEKKPEEAGLAKEAITLTFKLKDGSSHAVTVSEEVADNANFALTTTEARLAGKVFTIGKYKVQNLTRKLPDFEKKKEQE
jgi:hypothetical protein